MTVNTWLIRSANGLFYAIREGSRLVGPFASSEQAQTWARANKK